jgi:hypothetical protein
MANNILIPYQRVKGLFIISTFSDFNLEGIHKLLNG